MTMQNSPDPVTEEAMAEAVASQEEGETAPTPEPEPVEETVIEEPLEASEEIKEVAADSGETASAFVESLDAVALSLGNMRVSVLDMLVVIGVITLVLIGAWIATRICAFVLSKATRLDGTQRLLSQKISTIIIWTAAFFVGIDMLGIDLTAFAVFSGAFGLAIGFGLQKTFGNLIAGIILLMDKSIKPGDVIAVADQAGNESFGQIRKIGIRAISVVTRDQTEYLIPNETLMINQVVNWSYSSRDVRVKAPVGVAYGSDLGLVEKLLYQAVDETDRILARPRPRVNIMGFGDSSVQFEIRFWIQDPEEGLSNIRSDVYKRVWELFQENGVEIPFPQQDLHIRSSRQFDRLIEVMAEREEARKAR